MTNGNGECKHLNFVIRDTDLIGQAWCPDCLKPIGIAKCFKNLADEVRRVIAEAKEEKP